MICTDTGRLYLGKLFNGARFPNSFFVLSELSTIVNINVANVCSFGENNKVPSRICG